ncbi:MAG: hypothetical protein ABFE01_05655 [Phycisphaerales bacterium]
METTLNQERRTERPNTHAPRARARVFLALFIVGLVLSGLTAIPIRTGVPWLQKVAGEGTRIQEYWPAFAAWISRVDRGVAEAGREQPFLFYGTDWLAFGHIAIAVFFLGALRDPVRNLWVIHAGMIACILVIPWALVFGPIRGIPFFWQLIDCSFGVLGIVPLYLSSRYTRRMIEAGTTT